MCLKVGPPLTGRDVGSGTGLAATAPPGGCAPGSSGVSASPSGLTGRVPRAVSRSAPASGEYHHGCHRSTSWGACAPAAREGCSRFCGIGACNVREQDIAGRMNVGIMGACRRLHRRQSLRKLLTSPDARKRSNWRSSRGSSCSRAASSSPPVDACMRYSRDRKPSNFQ